MGSETNVTDSANVPAGAGSEHTPQGVSLAPARSQAAAAAASPDFVRAISDFLDTDPADLLHELGYYDRDEPR